MASQMVSGCDRSTQCRSLLTLGAALLVGLLTTACDLDDELSLPEPVCSEGEAVDFSGTWDIRGNFRLASCEDDRWNTSGIQLRMADIQVTQATDGTLTGDEPRSGFTWEEGEAEGREVSFKVSEQTSAGTMRLAFVACAEATAEIVGTFSVSGPGTCAGSGRFTLERR